MSLLTDIEATIAHNNEVIESEKLKQETIQMQKEHTMIFYEVLVGNIGKVWDSQSHDDLGNLEAAEGVYHSYIILSKGNEGQAAGEDVALWADGEILEEFEGSIHASLL